MHTLGSLQTQNTSQSFNHTLLADDASGISIQHGGEVFFGIIEEQEHIAACVNGSGQHVLALHAVGHTDHMRSIRNDHAVEAQLATEQIRHNFLAQGTGHNGVSSDIGIDLLHVFGHQNVTTHNGIQATVDQGLINMTIGSHPIIMTEMVDIVGHMSITVVLTVAGEVLAAAVNTVSLMQTIHESLAHVSNHLGIITVSTGQNFLTLPVVGDVNNRCKSHVTAGSLDLCAGNTAHSLCVLGLTGCTDLYLAGNKGAVGADTVTTLFGVACDKYGNLCILLKNAVLVQNHLAGHTVVTATAKMILFHQFLEVFLRIAGSQLPKQLTDLFLCGHGRDGAFHPCDVTIGQVIGFCS